MSIDTKAAFQDLKAFLLEAGPYALLTQKTAKVMLKDGTDALTETDLALSKLAHERLAPWLCQEGHVLIDEESIADIGTPEEVFAQSRYQWVLDPIDGTAGYAMGRFLWGVMLALLENGRPLIAGIYMPAMNRAVFADGERAYEIVNLGTPEEAEVALWAKEMKITSQTFIESFKGSRTHWGVSFADHLAWVNTPESAAQGFYSTLALQSAAASATVGCGLWDVAAAFVLGARSGFSFYNMESGLPIERFSPEQLRPNWKLKENLILCHPHMFESVRDALIK